MRESGKDDRGSRADMVDHHDDPPYPAFVMAARYDPIAQPPPQRRQRGIDEIDRGGDRGHLKDGEAALSDQVQRQPGEHEVEAVSVGEMADTKGPRRALVRNPPD